MIPRLLRPGIQQPLRSAATRAYTVHAHGPATPGVSDAVGVSKPAAAKLNKNILEVSGPDAAKFLKGQMCKDVESLGGGYSGFLNASGRVLHTVFSIPTPNGYLISWEPSSPYPLEELLKPFRLRSKVKFRDATPEYDVWSAWGLDASPTPKHQWRFGSGGAAERLWTWDGDRAPLNLSEGEAGTWDLRGGFGPEGMGRIVFAPKGKRPSVLNEHDEVPLRHYLRRRMSLGIPEGDAEIVPGHALPLESDMDIHGGVDFRKGCYLGQELTVRTYHTGATRKRLLPIRLYPLGTSSSPDTTKAAVDSLPPPPKLDGPADIKWVPPPDAASQRPKPAGKVMAVLDGEEEGGLGMGLIRLEYAERACWGGRDGREKLQGQLQVEINGEKWMVDVDMGEAFGQAESIKPPPAPPEDD